MSRRLDKNSKIDYNSNMLGGQKAQHPRLAEAFGVARAGQNAPKHSRRKERNVVEISL